MTESDRADEALFALWLSGYDVDPIAARDAWIQCLNRVQLQRAKAASRFSGGYFGLATRWWKLLQRKNAIAASWRPEGIKVDQQFIREFLGATQEWLRNESERDDNDFRSHVLEFIVRKFNTDEKSTRKNIRRMWILIDPRSALAIGPSIKLIQSFSVAELRRAQNSLTLVARALQHGMLISTPLDDVSRVFLPIKLMRDFIGTSLAKLLIMTNRSDCKLPIEESIVVLHRFVMRVQSTDIIDKTDVIPACSASVRSEWELTKKYLANIWRGTL